MIFFNEHIWQFRLRMNSSNEFSIVDGGENARVFCQVQANGTWLVMTFNSDGALEDESTPCGNFFDAVTLGFGMASECLAAMCNEEMAKLGYGDINTLIELDEKTPSRNPLFASDVLNSHGMNPADLDGSSQMMLFIDSHLDLVRKFHDWMKVSQDTCDLNPEKNRV